MVFFGPILRDMIYKPQRAYLYTIESLINYSGLFTILAVSYTHLDVYKRQLFWLWAISTSEIQSMA